MLKRYHQKVNQAQGHAERARNFYDENVELHPDSKEVVGDYIIRAIQLSAYVIAPVFRLSVKLATAEQWDKEILCRGLSR